MLRCAIAWWPKELCAYPNGFKYSLNRLKSEHNVKLITNNIILEQGENFFSTFFNAIATWSFSIQRHEMEYIFKCLWPPLNKQTELKTNQFKSCKKYAPLNIM